MGPLVIARRKFVDRPFSMHDLELLRQMLDEWRRSGSPAGSLFWCGAEAHCFPRGERDALCDAAVAAVPHVTVTELSPDVLGLEVPPMPDGAPPELALWRFLLTDPAFAHCTVLLRFVITGRFGRRGNVREPGRLELAMYGLPTEGGFLAKSIWKVRPGAYHEDVVRLARWPAEERFLAAFDRFCREVPAMGATNAALRAFRAFDRRKDPFFSHVRREFWNMAYTRMWTEVTIDRGPKPFAIRLLVPLGLGLLAALLVLIRWDTLSPHALVWLAFWGTCAFILALRVGTTKLLRARRYLRSMRAGLSRLYSSPVSAAPAPVASALGPIGWKCHGEAIEAGATYLGELAVEMNSSVVTVQRFYADDDGYYAVATMMASESLTFFPGKPIVIAQTRFAEGDRHVTLNQPQYRRGSRREVTGHCVARNAALPDVIEAHRRAVESLIDAGLTPLLDPPTLGEIAEFIVAEHEESRENWKRAPYSFADALHQIFEVTRKEYANPTPSPRGADVRAADASLAK